MTGGVELRWIERIAPPRTPNQGTLTRVLQMRGAAYLPWTDVPLYTLEQQASDQRELDAVMLQTLEDDD